ncbi:MAG TPA: GNAT family N-acetyltransferase [Candidatus Acidoferrum sp.]|jgi:predicted GNAT family acetyltransferase
MHRQANGNLPESLFLNPVWHALQTKHRHFADSTADACRYPANVVPFAAVSAPNADALRQLRSLLAPGESTWLIGDQYPQAPQLTCEETLQCFQMVLPANLPAPASTIEIVPLSSANAHEMVALTTLAFPGFFRARTYEMGSYYGIRSPSGELIAMGGERLQLNGYSEISAVCTHPSFRGRGFAASLIWRVARDRRRGGIVSWLHVGCANHHAVRLYLRMGFQQVRTVTLRRILRRDSAS